MLLVADGTTVDFARYAGVCAQAVTDASGVLAGPSVLDDPDQDHRILAYRDYVNVVWDIPEYFFGAEGTRKLIREICRVDDYEVSFVPVGNAIIDDLRGFASWLVVNFEKRLLTIVYDGDQVQRAGRSTFDRDRCLAKVFLHECGHARLHLHVIEERIDEETLDPSLDPEHEQDAWFYALAVWGVFSGDHGCAGRKFGDDEGADYGFLIA